MLPAGAGECLPPPCSPPGQAQVKVKCWEQEKKHCILRKIMTEKNKDFETFVAKILYKHLCDSSNFSSDSERYVSCIYLHCLYVNDMHILIWWRKIKTKKNFF